MDKITVILKNLMNLKVKELGQKFNLLMEITWYCNKMILKETKRKIIRMLK